MGTRYTNERSKLRKDFCYMFQKEINAIRESQVGRVIKFVDNTVRHFVPYSPAHHSTHIFSALKRELKRLPKDYKIVDNDSRLQF